MLHFESVFQNLNGRLVTQARILPFPTVEDLEVFNSGGFDLDVRGVANAVHPFSLVELLMA